MTYCAYSCTQYSLHTQYILLTHAVDLLCLQLHTVQSPHTQYILLTHADDLLCLQLHTVAYWCFPTFKAIVSLTLFIQIIKQYWSHYRNIHNKSLVPMIGRLFKRCSTHPYCPMTENTRQTRSIMMCIRHSKMMHANLTWQLNNCHCLLELHWPMKAWDYEGL